MDAAQALFIVSSYEGGRAANEAAADANQPEPETGMVSCMQAATTSFAGFGPPVRDLRSVTCRQLPFDP